MIATISTAGGHTWWLCPCCRKRLAELVADRVVIRNGKEVWSMPLRNEPEVTCPRCLATSVLDTGVLDQEATAA